jgi:hypothetical protein
LFCNILFKLLYFNEMMPILRIVWGKIYVFGIVTDHNFWQKKNMMNLFISFWEGFDLLLVNCPFFKSEFYYKKPIHSMFGQSGLKHTKVDALSMFFFSKLPRKNLVQLIFFKFPSSLNNVMQKWLRLHNNTETHLR